MPIDPLARITRHYDIELIPAFDREGAGTITVTGRGGVKLVVALPGMATPEDVGGRIGIALRVLEVGGRETARSAPFADSEVDH